MMQGIHRINGATQTAAAWKDWEWLVRHAEAMRIDWWKWMKPPGAKAGWRTIDRCAAKLRDYIHTIHPGEDLTPPSARLPQEVK